MSDYWENKSVFITGASSGIGRQVAVDLGKRGANLTLSARRENKLKEVADEIKSAGSDAIVAPLDVTEPEKVSEAVGETVKEFGSLDLTIANAGVSWATEADDIDLEATKQLFNININGVLNTVKPSIDVMKTQPSGHLAIVSSLASFRGLPRKAAYSASKAAVARFGESLRIDLADDDIDVTIIYPGYVRSEITEGRDQSRMPFFMDVEPASEKICNALEKRRNSLKFPWQMSLLAGSASMLPTWVTDPITSSVSAVD